MEFDVLDLLGFNFETLSSFGFNGETAIAVFGEESVQTLINSDSDASNSELQDFFAGSGIDIPNRVDPTESTLIDGVDLFPEFTGFLF